MPRGFQILAIPAAGTYGTLCVAKPVGEDRLVAVKVLKAFHGRDMMRRTRDEARMLHRLRHPNIVGVEALYDIGGRPVVVLEFIDGISLDKLIRQYPGGLDAPIALEIARQTADALDAAYSHPVGSGGKPIRIIHRDIKPSNILLSCAGLAKVVDFGMARGDFDDREAETQSLVMGSLGFTAPERLDHVPDSPKVDVYSLGVTLVLLLTGKTLVLPRFPSIHDDRLRTQLQHVSKEGVDDDVLRELLFSMCTAFSEQRLTPAEVVARIEACVPLPDLESWAKEHVPSYFSTPRGDPQSQAGWDQVWFLEGDLSEAIDQLRPGASKTGLTPPKSLLPPPAQDHGKKKPWWRFW